MDLNEIKDKMAAAHYLCVDKSLIHNLTANGAIVYAELVTRAVHYRERGMLADDGFFFCTVDDLAYECGVSQRQQTPIFKQLIERGLIAVRYQGFPKRRFIKVLTNRRAVERAFADTRQRKERHPMPEDVRAKISGFDPEILRREIDAVCKTFDTDSETREGVQMIYRKYVDFFGFPDTPYSRRSVEAIVENAAYLNGEFQVFDPEWFDDLLAEYQNVNVEGEGFSRSINNMLCEEVLEIIHERAR